MFLLKNEFFPHRKLSYPRSVPAVPPNSVFGWMVADKGSEQAANCIATEEPACCAPPPAMHMLHRSAAAADSCLPLPARRRHQPCFPSPTRLEPRPYSGRHARGAPPRVALLHGSTRSASSPTPLEYEMLSSRTDSAMLHPAHVAGHAIRPAWRRERRIHNIRVPSRVPDHRVTRAQTDRERIGGGKGAEEESDDASWKTAGREEASLGPHHRAPPHRRDMNRRERERAPPRRRGSHRVAVVARSAARRLRRLPRGGRGEVHGLGISGELRGGLSRIRVGSRSRGQGGPAAGARSCGAAAARPRTGEDYFTTAAKAEHQQQPHARSG